METVTSFLVWTYWIDESSELKYIKQNKRNDKKRIKMKKIKHIHVLLNELLCFFQGVIMNFQNVPEKQTAKII